MPDELERVLGDPTGRFSEVNVGEETTTVDRRHCEQMRVIDQPAG